MRISFILLALAPAAAWCGNVVTNATDLVSCLGFGGSADVEFSIDATVVWGTWHRSKDFVAKAADGYIKLVDKAFWPRSFIRDGDRIRAHGRTVALTNNIANGFVNADCFDIAVVGHTVPEPPKDATNVAQAARQNACEMTLNAFMQCTLSSAFYQTKDTFEHAPKRGRGVISTERSSPLWI